MAKRLCRKCNAEVAVERHPRFVVFRCTAPNCDWKSTKVISQKGG